jgi:hypothetical protein
MQRLQGGPCSAPTHFIFRRRQTVQALNNIVTVHAVQGSEQAHREPLVVFGFGSSLSAAGLCPSKLSSERAFFLLLSPIAPTRDEEGLFPFELPGK